MSIDAFMWFTGGSPPIEGETTDSTMKANKAFELETFSWGANNPVTIGSQKGGMGSGKVTLDNFQVSKRTDNASPVLFDACCKGTHYPSATVAICKAGGKQMIFVEYLFTEVMIERINWNSGGGDSPNEDVIFAYGSVTINYWPQSTDGTQGTLNSAQWSQLQNTASA